MVEHFVKRLVPSDLWALAAPLIESSRQRRPQGGGTAHHSEHAVFAAVVFVLTSGCAWRDLPPVFGVSKATAHRRFTQWTKSELWARLHDEVLKNERRVSERHWSQVMLDAAGGRATKSRNSSVD